MGHLGHASTSCQLYECGGLVMPLTVDPSGPLDAVNKMMKSIQDLPEKMALELTAWQLEDLHRKPENIMTDQVENSVITMITEHTSGDVQTPQMKKAKSRMRK